jgi:hypothetical protein
LEIFNKLFMNPPIISVGFFFYRDRVQKMMIKSKESDKASSGMDLIIYLKVIRGLFTFLLDINRNINRPTLNFCILPYVLFKFLQSLYLLGRLNK